MARPRPRPDRKARLQLYLPYELKGCTVAEISAATGIPEGTIKNDHFREERDTRARKVNSAPVPRKRRNSATTPKTEEDYERVLDAAVSQAMALIQAAQSEGDLKAWAAGIDKLVDAYKAKKESLGMKEPSIAIDARSVRVEGKALAEMLAPYESLFAKEKPVAVQQESKG